MILVRHVTKKAVYKFRLPKDMIKSLKYKKPSISENKITNLY